MLDSSIKGQIKSAWLSWEKHALGCKYWVLMLADVFAIFFAKVILVLIISIEPVVIRGYRCSWLCNYVAEYKTYEGAHADDHKL